MNPRDVLDKQLIIAKRGDEKQHFKDTILASGPEGLFAKMAICGYSRLIAAIDGK